MPTQFDTGFLVGLLVGEGHFGGDGRQAQVTLRMHVRHEAIFRWLERTFPGGRLYGPYHHGGRDYLQWMARGPYLRDELVPLLDRWLSPDLDRHSFERFELMKARYPRAVADPAAPGPAGSSGSRATSAPATSADDGFADLFTQLREAWPPQAQELSGSPTPPRLCGGPRRKTLLCCLLLRRLLHRCGRIHDLHDPFQVIDGGELDDDLPLTLAQFHLDPGLEQVGEAISQVTETGCGRRLGAGACRAARRGIVRTDRDDLFDGTDRQALGYDPAGQALLRFGSLQAEQGPGVAGTEHARRYPLLDRRRQVQQAQGVADVRSGAAYLARQFLMGSTEIVKELLVRSGLFERIELLPVQVLDQGVPEELVVLGLLDDRADLGQPGSLAGPPPPLAHDELIPAGARRTDDHRLQQADLPDRLRQLAA